MKRPVLEILETGLGVSLQDEGRRGWKRFGVPPGGALDEHAAGWANVLLGNPLAQPVLEILLFGARFRSLGRITIALTGAAASAPGQRWQTRVLEPDEIFAVPYPDAGLWSYLACTGGFEATRWFGSVSRFPRGGLGRMLTRGDILHSANTEPAPRVPAVGTRWVDTGETRQYGNPPMLRVWPGPQWDLLGNDARDAFFSTRWQLSARSDRTGYRLAGPAIAASAPGIPSEPVLPGSIQIPPDGQPIVTMRDGPTVGGYPKLGLVEPEDLSRLAQCRPGQEIHFRPIDPPPAPPGKPAPPLPHRPR